jgi:hypothetical protein
LQKSASSSGAGVPQRVQTGIFFTGSSVTLEPHRLQKSARSSGAGTPHRSHFLTISGS